MRQVTRDNEKKRFSIFLLSSLLAYILWVFVSGGLRVNLVFIILDLILFLFTFFAFLFIFSQFIFPLTSYEDRLAAFKRLLLYVFAQHGPINNIKDGFTSNIYHNLKINNPGVIRLDSASAALLGNKTGLNRVVGPGVVFTEKSESVVNSIDLHIQKHWLGPLENENPFSTKRKTENSVEYQERRKRADQTRGFTRDGIEIIPSFSISFKLISSPGAGNTAFGFNPLSVQRALIDQPIQRINQENEMAVQDWNKLPGFLLTDIWREILQKFRFSEIFHENDSALKLILEHIQARLTEKEIIEIGEDDVFVGKKITSNEFTLLQDKGIVFLKLHLQQLWFSPEIETQLARRIKSNDYQNHNHPGPSFQSFKENEDNLSAEEKVSQVISQTIANFHSPEKISPQRLKEQLMLIHPEWFE